MWSKIIVLFTLLFYVNCIAYHESSAFNQQSHTFFQGDTLVNFFLEDVLDLPTGEEAESTDYQYDDYRLGPTLNIIIMATVLLLFFKRIFPTITIAPKIFKDNKIIPLQIGYYRFLSLLKPH